MNKVKTILASSLLMLASVVGNSATALGATIAISEPANGQSFTGNNFRVSGTTDPNSTVLVKKGTTVLKQTKSGSDGKWSADLVNLPDGENKVSATVIKNAGFAYYASSPDGGMTIHINRLRFSDNAINPGGSPWPVTSSSPFVGLMPSPGENVFYGFAGSLSTSTLPVRFDIDAPADPAAVTGYPSNPGVNKLDFNSDGSKMYVPNMLLSNVSVVDVEGGSNSWVEDIPFPATPIAASRSIDGRIYVSRQDSQTSIIDANSDSITGSFTTSCMAVLYIFSEDPAYPYFYGFCPMDGKILQMKTSDNSENAAWNVGYSPTGGYLSPDNKRIHFFSSSFVDAVDSQTIVEVNTSTGSIASTAELTDGAIGFLASPDAQRLIVATPGAGLTTNNIDILDLETNTVTESLPLSGVALVVAFLPASSSDTSIADISVVLGAKAASSGSLAETGALAVSVTLLLGLILGSSAFVYYDYRKHKKPLLVEDANVHYTLLHHVKVVTVPLLKYRLSFQFESRQSSDSIHKF